MQNVKNFVVYYGESRAKELAKYDLAIVEPLGQNDQTISYLRNQNTLTFAYVSFLEVHPMSCGYNLLKEEDYLTQHGKITENSLYHTKLVDLCSRRWQSILLNHISDLFVVYGYDGIFIDTIADIEYFDLPEIIKNSLLNALILLMQKIKERFPDLMIIQNNGVEFLYHYTARFISGICMESPPVLSQRLIETLEFLKKEQNLNIFILTNDQSDLKMLAQLQKLALNNDYYSYHAANGYQELH